VGRGEAVRWGEKRREEERKARLRLEVVVWQRFRKEYVMLGQVSEIVESCGVCEQRSGERKSGDSENYRSYSIIVSSYARWSIRARDNIYTRKQTHK